jgi:hypothetical protein
MEREIAVFDKNSYEEVKVKIIEWKCQDYLDIRTWIKSRYDEEEKSRPTKKGITLNADSIPALVDALKKAAEALKEEDKIQEGNNND